MNSIIEVIYSPYDLLVVPLQHSLLELLHHAGENYKSVVRCFFAAAISFILVSSLGYYNLAIRYLTWVLLGIASSIGFGFGMHTFVLFLAPHIAAVTMAAHSCQSLDFPEPPYPAEIICPEQTGDEQITFIRILQKVGVEAFMWGLGTAIGELPPYLAARLRAQAIGRKTGGDELESNQETAGWESWMIYIINKIGFIGILLLAAVPNPLFDAAGVASGIAQVPFLSFFGATLMGKAVIKALLQTSFVIFSFHNRNLDSWIQHIDLKLSEFFPSIKDLNLNKSLTIFLEEQRNNVLKKRLGEPKQPPMISKIFNWIICACFALFTISLIKALDKQYRDRKARSARRIE